ncbi:molybdopterin molybdotransferase MoeA [Microbacterium sp. bgisy203]|uniref:molybdopterin molybdotransferase MoeA n=1 Tax=Microbacterium sp. bgisy203 TaxID=3413799 RepID=UPI003D725197
MTSIADHVAAVRQVLAAVPVRERAVGVSAADVARHPSRTRARRLTRDVVAAGDVPRFDNSQMDGYAVRAADLAGADAAHPVTLPVAAPIAAGASAGALAPGTAAPIMTGAPIPAGADAIVPVERTAPGTFDAEHVTFAQPVAPGTFVRVRGADIAQGDLLAAAGTPVRPAHLGAFAAASVGEVCVGARVRVLVVTTGRELATAHEPTLGSGDDARIPDAVGGMLVRAVTDAGARARWIVCPSDDPDEFRALLARAGRWPDVIVTVGGVSRGAYEVVKLAFAGERVRFGHLDLQPGGPQGLGVVALDGRDVPVLCFPGNPVSALISFELFLRPWLRGRAGLTPSRRVERLPLAEAIESPAHQHQIRRGSLRGDGTVATVGGPGSHLIAHYAAADALVHVPVGVAHLEAGDDVEVWVLDE